MGLASPVLISASLAAVRAERVGMASGSVNTFRQLGYALGIAGLGTIFASRLSDSIVHSATFASPRAAAVAASQGGAKELIAHSQPAPSPSTHGQRAEMLVRCLRLVNMSST